MPEKPLIDLFICTYNEEEAILERTIIGATGMDYPNYRVWVLDDGKRPWLQAMCENLGCGYIARPDNSHAKAGNINYALGKIAQLPNPPQYISILDADFVPDAELSVARDDAFPRRERSASSRRRSISSIPIRSRPIFWRRTSGRTNNDFSSTS